VDKNVDKSRTADKEKFTPLFSEPLKIKNLLFFSYL